MNNLQKKIYFKFLTIITSKLANKQTSKQANKQPLLPCGGSLRFRLQFYLLSSVSPTRLSSAVGCVWSGSCGGLKKSIRTHSCKCQRVTGHTTVHSTKSTPADSLSFRSIRPQATLGNGFRTRWWSQTMAALGWQMETSGDT
jgi:hypothetical protein